MLDPRVDAEPLYWAALRKRAGLRADWSWPVLAARAVLAQTRQLVTVFLDGGEPRGVVWAAWVTATTRRDRFASGRRGRFGFLDVRSPHNSAVPGWWFAGYAPGERPERYASTSASTCRSCGASWGSGSRPAAAPARGGEVPEVAGRFRKVRPIEPIGFLDTAGLWSDDRLAALAKKRRRELRKINRLIADDPAISGPAAVRCGRGRAIVDEVVAVQRDQAPGRADRAAPHFGGLLAKLLAEPDVLTVDHHDPRTGRRLAVALQLDHPTWPVFRT